MPDTLSQLHEASGKVRELYGFGDRLLLVASDRISAFDVVLPTPIPDKGRVLTGLSRFWFERTRGLVRNHMLSVNVADFPEEAQGTPDLAGRSMLAQRLQMLPIECVVRGYLVGSGWKDYRATGSVCGHAAPGRPARGGQAAGAALHAVDEGDRGPRREHRPRRRHRPGRRGAVRRDRAALDRALPHGAPTTPCERGIIIADTKFEFGVDEQGRIVLGDEVLTPDSSRFWPVDEYAPGRLAAVLRQAVRPQLAGDARLGQDASGAGDPRRRRRGHPRAATSRRTSGSPASRSRPTSTRPEAAREGDGHGAAPGRHPRPPGRGRRGARCRGSDYAASDVRAGKVFDLELDVARSPRGDEGRRPDRRAGALEPADRGVRRRRPGAGAGMNLQVAVARLPRLVRRPRRAAGGRADGGRAACACGTLTPTSAAPTAVIVPGGFSYGDYLRPGALAALAPAMTAVRGLAEAGRPGARHLQRLSGADRGRAPAGGAAPERPPAVPLPGCGPEGPARVRPGCPGWSPATRSRSR